MIADDFDGIAAEMRRIREKERKPPPPPTPPLEAYLSIGTDLNTLGEFWNVRRLSDDEPDDSLRRRILDRITNAVAESA